MANEQHSLLYTIDECQPNESGRSLRSALKRVNASLEAYQGIRAVNSFHVVVKICFERERNEEKPKESLYEREGKRRKWRDGSGTEQQQ